MVKIHFLLLLEKMRRVNLRFGAKLSKVVKKFHFVRLEYVLHVLGYR
jgi:hypothetical protein